MLVYAVYLARHALSVIWHGENVAGDVIEIVAVVDEGGRLTGYAPRVGYSDRQGQRYTFTPPNVAYPPLYAAGDAVSVYYDREDPTRAALASFATFWLVPFLAAGASGLLMLLAGVLAAPATPRAAALPKVMDEGVTPPQPRDQSRVHSQVRSQARPIQFHPLNPVAYKHYFAHLAAPGGTAKVQITEAAAALPEGRIPLVLCEVLASMAHLAKDAGAISHIGEHMPHLKQARAFGADGGRGLAFLFEETGFIVMPSVLEAGPWRWARHLMSFRTSGRKFVPAETVWDAAGRHRSLAQWWDKLRDEVEAWVDGEALKRDPARPFIFAGHGIGGGLAILAAYEFKKRGRNVVAVVTFGAPQPGGAKFVAEYHRLGLDERTVNLVYRAGSPLMAAWPFLYRSAGAVWLLEQRPMTGREAAGARNDSHKNDGQGLATFALDALRKDEAADAAMMRPLRRRLLLAALAFFSKPRAAISAHESSRHYALVLDIMAYQRLREVMASEGTAEELKAAAKALGDHLAYVRGSRPEAQRAPFAALDRLPVTVADAADLEALLASAGDHLV